MDLNAKNALQQITAGALAGKKTMPKIGSHADQKTVIDIDEYLDPWGGTIKQWRVENTVRKEVYLRTNSLSRARAALAEHKGSSLINSWHEENERLNLQKAGVSSERQPHEAKRYARNA